MQTISLRDIPVSNHICNQIEYPRPMNEEIDPVLLCEVLTEESSLIIRRDSMITKFD